MKNNLINSLKTGKAAGMDIIQAELLKNAGNMMIHYDD